MKLCRPIVIVLVMLFTFALRCLGNDPAHQSGDLRDREYKRIVLKKIAGLVKDKYVYKEKAKDYAEELLGRFRRGAYAAIIDAGEFAARITADLQAITHDKHVSLRRIESSDIGERAVGALHHPVRFHRLARKENTGFRRLEWINGHIGYLDLIRFNAIDQARDKIEGAMRFLENADAIIIDVRENGGGSGDYLSSFFLPHPTQLTGWYYRENDYLEECWTTSEMNGKPLTEVPLFVLIGPNTFSAAEIFAYDLQALKRAVLVGERTRGGAHSIDLFKIDDQFEINISTSYAINPVTGGNWEGTGVIPDVPAPAGRVLEIAVELAEKAGMEYAKTREQKLKQAVDRMQAQLDLAEKGSREHDLLAVKSALDSMFRIGGEAGLIDYFFVFVLAYHYHTYSGKAEPIEIAILEKSAELFPNSVMAQRVLAGAYRDIGNKKLALYYYEKALALDPDNIVLKKKLARLKNEKNRRR